MTADHEHGHGGHRSPGDHGHDHDHAEHDHEHGGELRAWWHKLSHVVTPHSHDSADKVDSAMETSREGIRALWISLAVLGATAIMQAIVVVCSGSVALLGDTCTTWPTR
jgi:Co/Zn/Cd efflux system component